MLQRIVLFWLVVVAIDTSTILSLAQRERRIVGGKLATSDQVPYLVNIRRNGIFHCGGSLVTPRCVLTAAHCVRDGTPADFVAHAGVTFLSDRQNARRVDMIFIPDQYNNTNFEHDIAVFRLKRPLRTDKHIKLIRIADFTPQQGDIIRVSGWGLTHENATSLPNRMRTVEVRVVQHELCRALYADYRPVSEAMFCASVPGYKDACLADSGGPAIANGQLVGIVSWARGRYCARADSPGVYANVHQMRRWIFDIIYRHCY